MTVDQFLQLYEEVTNSHDFAKVRPLIADDALYFFSDATLQGITQIEQSFLQTWATIQNEQYSITNIRWLLSTEDTAVCSYDFHWSGLVAHVAREGHGRGTNVMSHKTGSWQMIHEHLSKVPEL